MAGEVLMMSSSSNTALRGNSRLLLMQVVTGAVLIRDQFGNGVGDILIDIRRSDGGQVASFVFAFSFSLNTWRVETFVFSWRA